LDNQLSAEEAYAVTAISQYYELKETEEQLPQNVGICDHCGRNIIQFNTGKNKLAHCLSDAGFKELLNRIILQRKNKQR
jgi:hypothetical protein